MGENRRRTDLSDEELDKLSSLIVGKLPKDYTASCHAFSEEEISTVRGFIQTKRSASKVMLALIGALLIWALKDIYNWVYSHLHWIAGR